MFAKPTVRKVFIILTCFIHVGGRPKKFKCPAPYITVAFTIGKNATFYILPVDHFDYGRLTRCKIDAEYPDPLLCMDGGDDDVYNNMESRLTCDLKKERIVIKSVKLDEWAAVFTVGMNDPQNNRRQPFPLDIKLEVHKASAGHVTDTSNETTKDSPAVNFNSTVSSGNITTSKPTIIKGTSNKSITTTISSTVNPTDNGTRNSPTATSSTVKGTSNKSITTTISSTVNPTDKTPTVSYGTIIAIVIAIIIFVLIILCLCYCRHKIASCCHQKQINSEEGHDDENVSGSDNVDSQLLGDENASPEEDKYWHQKQTQPEENDNDPERSTTIIMQVLDGKGVQDEV